MSDSNKLTEINWRSSKQEIEDMTIEQAIEILQGQINLGKTKGDFRPREHLTKALEIAVKCMKNNIE